MPASDEHAANGRADARTAPAVPPPTPSWRYVGQSLRSRNYRRFLTGLVLSETGTWVQETAELWLILTVTESGVALGIHSVLRFGPVLLFGAYGGLLADRLDRLSLLRASQVVLALAAGFLAVITWTTGPSVPAVYAAVLVQGLVTAVEHPVRRAFIRDLVDDQMLANAVSLHATIATFARALGPAVGGVIIATLGMAWCFTINAASYFAVIVVLFLLDRGSLRSAVHLSRGRGQVREGLTFAWQDREMRGILLLVMLVGVAAWNWNVILPVYSTSEFGGSASLYGAMVSAVAGGAFLGALFTARYTYLGRRFQALTGVAIVLSMVAVGLSPWLSFSLISLVALGATAVSFTVAAQTRLQLGVPDRMSGRVVALFSVGFVGSKPIGGMLGGWIIDLAGPRSAFLVGAAVVAVVTASLWLGGLGIGSEPARPRPD